jgi:cytochrome b involved in lipid metabolism
MYARFLTGYPFGFERIIRMANMARGSIEDPWVVEAGMEQTVRVEAAVHVLVYAAFACGAALNANVRSVIFWYWLLPHILGAGHLRWYQFAEHRACEKGHFTDLDAWGTTRTTYTWWLYRRLAWNMPYHIEHHAWPAVSFHLLPAVHERIKDNQPKSRCLISGDKGYSGIHIDFLKRVIRGEKTEGPLVEHRAAVEEPNDVDNPQAAGNGNSKNRLGDSDAMEKLPRFTLAQVAEHKAERWLTVNGIVIDPSTFLKDHPGGEQIIINKAGQDATKMFKMIHPDKTLENHLPDACVVGVLTEPGTGLSEPLLNKSNGQH